MTDIATAKEKVKKIQKVVYGILCDIDDFCRENNITYFLSGGSCLGAVRHHGFIPWDDDADIMMPRKDYERFLKLFPQAYDDKYGVGALSIDKKWTICYARIWDKNTSFKHKYLDEPEQGIFVDLFPIDGLPKSASKRKLYYINIRLLREIGYESMRTTILKQHRFKMLRRLTEIVTRPIGPRFFFAQIDRAARKYDFDKCDLVGATLAIHYWEKETISRDCMNKAVYIQFEDRDFPVPVGYDTYLSNLYGDYMTVPKDAEENGYTHLGEWILNFDTREENS